MKKILIPILLIIISYNTIYSSSKVDSLISLLPSTAQDTNKLNVLKELTYLLINIDPNKAKIYLDTLLNVANQINDNSAIIAFYIHSGILEANLGNFENSNALFKTAYDLAEKNGLHNFEAMALLNIGCNFDQMGNYNKAIESFNKSIEICNKYNLDFLLGNIYVALGILNSNFNNFDFAEKNYLEAIKVYERIKVKGQISYIYNNLANVFLNKNDNKKALFYAEKNLNLNLNANDFQGLAIAYHTMGAVKHNLGENKEAIEYFKKSIKLKEQMNNLIGKSTSLLALAEIYFTINQYNKSLEYLDQAKEIFISKNITPKLMNLYGEYHKIYLKLGNFQKAYEYYYLQTQLKDSLFNIEKEKTVAELSSKYDLANKEKENIKLQNEKDSLTLYIIIIILGMVIITGTSIVLYINNRYIKNLNNKLKELNATKDKFFSIISHDLKGPISSLHKLIDIIVEEHKSLTDDEMNEILTQLRNSSHNTYSLLENLLTWARSQQNKIALNPETINLHFLANTITSHLNTNLLAKNIKIINNIPQDSKVIADPNLISTVIRNLISNAIKYTYEGGEIVLNYKVDKKGEVLISVSDNGVGMSRETAMNLFAIDKTKSLPGTKDEKGTGLGLILCKEFTDMHRGRIWVESELGKGTCVSFTINN